jgi:hypothetical protein
MYQLDWGPRGPAAGPAPSAAGGSLVVTDGAGVVATYRRGGDVGEATQVVLHDGTVGTIVRPGRVVARAGWSRRVLRGKAGDLAGLEVGPGGQGTAWIADGRRLALQRVRGTWEVSAPEAGVLVRVGASSIGVAEQERAGLVALALLVLDLVCVPPDTTRTWCAQEDLPLAGRRAVLRS